MQDWVQYVESEVDLVFVGENDGEMVVDGVGFYYDEEIREVGYVCIVVCLWKVFIVFLLLDEDVRLFSYCILGLYGVDLYVCEWRFYFF